MSDKQILLVIEGTYPWYRGGVSEWVHQYVSAFSDVTFHILQVATDQYLDTSIDEALYSVPNHVESFVRIPPPDLEKPWKSESRQWKDEHLTDIKPLATAADIIHVANTGFAGWLGKELATDHQKPLMLTEHALYWKEVEMGAVALECGYKVPAESRRKRSFVQMFQSVAKEIYSASDVVVSVSECNISAQQKLGAMDVRYIPNGISKDWLISSSKVYRDKLTIGWIGRCAEMKNPRKFFDFVDAFETIGFQNIQFLMLSCDANEPELAAQVKERSKTYSQLELIWNRSAEQYIDQMDALCITSHNESQPLVLFESLARKVLPVGWQAGDVTSKYGFIVDSETSKAALAEQVKQLWQQPGQWQEMVQSRHDLVAEHHTWENIFSEYRTILNRLTNSEKTYVE